MRLPRQTASPRNLPISDHLALQSVGILYGSQSAEASHPRWPELASIGHRQGLRRRSRCDDPNRPRGVPSVALTLSMVIGDQEYWLGRQIKSLHIWHELCFRIPVGLGKRAVCIARSGLQRNPGVGRIDPTGCGSHGICHVRPPRLRIGEFAQLRRRRDIVWAGSRTRFPTI